MANENVTLSDIAIQWHPVFCTVAELEFLANRRELTFQPEYNLSRKPLQIDLLVVEKRDHVNIRNEIGRIFRRYIESHTIENRAARDGMASILDSAGIKDM